MATSSGSRKHLAVEVRESLGKRVVPLVGVGSGRGVDMDVVGLQELLQHLPGSNQEVAITALASELERIF